MAVKCEYCREVIMPDSAGGIEVEMAGKVELILHILYLAVLPALPAERT